MEQSPTLWSKKATPVFPKLDKNLQTEVCVIGAGMAGISCAYQLSRQGRKVVVLDDGVVGEGETARTTSHLTAVLDDRFSVLEKRFGKEFVKAATDSHMKAIDFIEETVLKENIACAFRRLDAYLYNSPKTHEDLKEELQAATRAGLKAEMVPRAPLSFDTGPSLKFSNQAQFRPLDYLRGLCHSIVKSGGEIFSQTHAENIEEEKKGYLIATDAGYTIEAENVIVATSSPINSRFFPHTKQAAYRSYVIVGKVPKEGIPFGLYYDTLDPYHYVRVEHADDHDLLIIGGEDHRVGEAQHPEEKFEILEEWAKKRFPMMTTILYKWSGQIFEPVDDMAFIGRANKNESLFIATGFSGNGMTYGTIAGILLTDLIQGKPNRWESLYSPDRLPRGESLYEFCKENANTLWQYRDWLTSSDEMTEAKIKPGSGAVLRDGLKKLAIYRDDEGVLHKLSAVCPHLGGIVRWNEAEKTWDCPCHGSRFTSKGKVIDGPANSSLEPHE